MTTDKLTFEEAAQAMADWVQDMHTRGYANVTEEEKTSFRGVLVLLQYAVERRRTLH